jgi:hypothetical protein
MLQFYNINFICGVYYLNVFHNETSLWLTLYLTASVMSKNAP